jgi:hypothetical protein
VTPEQAKSETEEPIDDDTLEEIAAELDELEIAGEAEKAWSHGKKGGGSTPESGRSGRG